MSQSIFPAPEVAHVHPGRVLIETTYGKAPLNPTWEGNPVHVVFNAKRDEVKGWLIEADEDPKHINIAPVFTLASHVDRLPVQLYLAEADKDHVPLTTTTDRKKAIKLNFIPENSFKDHPTRYYIAKEGTELLLTVVPPANFDDGFYGHLELKPLAGKENAQLWEVDPALLK
ncbi:hypothetical protein EXIGLDRAFT_764014 [Exidia glandulosa HHB12029]|uniref:Uncharacterized protein n=1 Tax=Exidia glandulosa HHB12029 TaxID=1314781 RepID=A0A165LGG4_EXIGL|nr:hypothetical protein EXIGLDRAFT_764014 [Exidia glandulosa HHB12029]